MLPRFLFSMVDDIVDTSEVIDSFQYVVNTDSHFSNANGVRLKDIARLVVSQPTTIILAKVELDLSFI